MASLTTDEVFISKQSLIDVGAGYPIVPIPNWIRDLYRISEEHLNKLFTRRTLSSFLDLDTELLALVCKFLGISERHIPNGFITFSGSIALDRSIKAVSKLGASMIIQSPAIDIGVYMAKETNLRRIDHVIRVPPHFEHKTEALLEAVKNDTNSILITSPDNPTGHTLDREDFLALLKLSEENDLTIIIDACFSSVNPFGRRIDLIANFDSFDSTNAKWIMVWDTGKTFGLNEEKLGFIFCSSNIREKIKMSVEILQFGVAARQKYLFIELLKSPYCISQVEDLNLIVRSNAEIIFTRLSSIGYSVLMPEAGSVLLVDISKRVPLLKDTEFCDELMRLWKVGVIKGSSFFHANEPWKHNYIRVALARSQEIIESLCDSLARV